jgi:NTP pyrophosphatase (non-canonical NTP hydrolase)
MPLTLNDYQKSALKTTRGHDQPDEMLHLVLGLVGETGEVAEKFKKLVRDKNSDVAQLDLDDMKKELGDVLWYLAVLADYLGVPLEEIGNKNLAKLADRQKRGVLKGSGDNR